MQDDRRLLVDFVFATSEVADFFATSEVDESRDDDRDFDVAETSSDAISDAPFSGDDIVIFIYKFKRAQFNKRDFFTQSVTNLQYLKMTNVLRNNTNNLTFLQYLKN